MSQNINKCDIMFIIERVKIFLKSVLTSFEKLIYNSSCVAALMSSTENKNGVWLSLARAPGLGPGGRRFESCHPDCCRHFTVQRICGCSSMVEH